MIFLLLLLLSTCSERRRSSVSIPINSIPIEEIRMIASRAHRKNSSPAKTNPSPEKSKFQSRKSLNSPQKRQTPKTDGEGYVDLLDVETNLELIQKLPHLPVWLNPDRTINTETVSNFHISAQKMEDDIYTEYFGAHFSKQNSVFVNVKYKDRKDSKDQNEDFIISVSSKGLRTLVGRHIFLSTEFEGISRLFIFPEQRRYVFEFQTRSNKFQESIIFTDVCGYIIAKDLLFVRSAVGLRFWHVLQTKLLSKKISQNGVLASFFTGSSYSGNIEQIALLKSVEKFTEARFVDGKIYVKEKDNDPLKIFAMEDYEFTFEETSHLRKFI